MDNKPDTSFAAPMIDLFDFGPSPIDNGADFACSWSGRHRGQLIVRAGVLHVSSGDVSMAIPRERLLGWSIRPEGDLAALTVQSNDTLQLQVPLDVVAPIERALNDLHRG